MKPATLVPVTALFFIALNFSFLSFAGTVSDPTHSNRIPNGTTRSLFDPPGGIDDDRDGIPDYVEMNNPVALQDANGNLVPNYCDPTYPGYVDNNGDNINDFFDPSADADNDNISNDIDPNFPGYTDSNGDQVNDQFDWDLDGIPNHDDRDSDNDGIPDTAENFGVDVNGDGTIDNYSDNDSDGLSQNVDGNTSGAANSGTGLGTRDTDNDGVPNYLDLDSDNDGIPDVVEVYGADSNNDALADSFYDNDDDGYGDLVDADADNNEIAENLDAALLRTGIDENNDGRADSFPNKNLDGDSRPSPYDLDSDSDGLTDVTEAVFPDMDLNGLVDGAVNTKGWNTIVSGLSSLSLPNTDGSGRVNIYDIDSDNDGIPDNVEGLATLAYLLPGGVDTDGDGIDNNYDNFIGFGGNGIDPYDKDGDTVPDYLDADADNDGLGDIVEGNDFNFNGLPDDNTTLTGIDTDGDGLDNRFDNNNSSAEGTSAYMGNAGTTTGDATPGSITVLQHTAIAAGLGCASERDWRCIWYVLSCDIITFKASMNAQNVALEWKVICRQEIERFVIERSTDRYKFIDVLSIPGRYGYNETEIYNVLDDVSEVSGNIIYYRLRAEAVSGRETVSNIIAVKRNSEDGINVQVMPNPVRGNMHVMVNSDRETLANIQIIDGNGRAIYSFREKLFEGSNTLNYSQTANLPAGMYYLNVNLGDRIITKKINILK